MSEVAPSKAWIAVLAVSLLVAPVLADALPASLEPTAAPHGVTAPPSATVLARTALEALRRPYYAQLAGAPLPPWARAYAWQLAAIQNPVLDPGFSIASAGDTSIWVPEEGAFAQDGALHLVSNSSATQSFPNASAGPDALACTNGCIGASPVTDVRSFAFRAQGSGTVRIDLIDPATGIPFRTTPYAFQGNGEALHVPLSAFHPTAPAGFDPQATPEDGQLSRIVFAAQDGSAVVDDVVLDADTGTIARASLDHGPHPRIEDEWRSVFAPTFEAHDGLAAHLFPLDDGSFLAVLVEYGPSGARVLPTDASAAQLDVVLSSGQATSVPANATAVALGATPYGRLFAEAGLAGDGLRLRPDSALQPLAWRVTLTPEGASLYAHNASGFLNLGKLLDPGDPVNDALDAVPDALVAQAPASLFEDSDGDGYPDLVEKELFSSPYQADDVPGRNAPLLAEETTSIAAAAPHIRAIRAPLSTMPAFLAPGEDITIDLDVTAPEGVWATLVPALGRIGAPIPLTLRNASAPSPSLRWPGSDLNVTHFAARLPNDINASALDRLYDLHVGWLGGKNDSQPRAVEVVSRYAAHPRVAVVADPQWASASPPLQNATDPLATIVPELNLLRPDLVLVVGDVTKDGGATALEGAYASIQGLDVPTFVVAGDRDLAATTEGDGTALWQSIFGPLYYPIDYGPSFHGVALDTADWLYADRAEASGVSLTQGGQVRAAQLSWVQHDLAQSNATTRIAFGHHSPAWAQDAWQNASLEDPAAGPQGTDATGYLRVILGAFGRYLPTPLDSTSNAPAAITTGAEEGWTGAGRLELRDALRAGGVGTYFAGHKLVDRVAQERDDGIVVEADGNAVHFVARDGTNQSASLADIELGNQSRVLYLDTTAAGNHSAEYAGYRLYEINGTRGSGLWDGYDPVNNKSLPGGWNLAQRAVGLFSVPSGNLSENVSTSNNTTFVNITSGLDEAADVTLNLTFRSQPGLAWAQDARISHEWRVGDDRDVLVSLHVDPQSRVSTLVYVDALPPTTSIRTAPSWTNTTAFNVTIGTASDDHKLADITLQACRLDACESWMTVRSGLAPGEIVPIDLPSLFTHAPDGPYGVRTVGRDAAGNVEPAPHESIVRLDTLAPVVTLNVTPSDQADWHRAPVDATFSCQDPDNGSGCASLQVRLDNASWAAAAASDQGTLHVATEGRHVLEARANDTAGTWSADAEASFGIDTAPPKLGLIADGPSGNAGWFVGNVTVNASCVDATSGCVEADGNVSMPGERVALPATLLSADGRHNVSISAEDAAGGRSDAALTVLLDSRAPLTTAELSPRPTSGWSTGNVTLYLNATDATSGVAHIDASIDGAAWQAITQPLVISTDAEHTIKYRSTDVAGNVEPERSLAFGIDHLPPVTTPSPASDEWHTTPLNVTLSCTDETSACATTRYRIDQGAWTDYSAPIPFDSQGTHLLQYDSTDTAGNEATGSTVVKLDLTSPILRVTSPSDSVTMARTLPRVGGEATVGPSGGAVEVVLRNTTSDASWDGTGFTPSGRVTMSLVGSAWEALAGNALPALLPEGEYALSVRVTDGAGRASPVENFTLHIDRTAPTVTVKGAAGPRTLDHVPILVDVADQTPTSVTAIETRFAAPGAPFDAWSPTPGMAQAPGSPLDVPLGKGDGRYQIRATAQDAVGNEGTSPPLDVLLDTLPPVLALTSASRSLAAETLYNATFSVQDMSTVASLHLELTLDDGAPLVADPDPAASWLTVPIHVSTRSLDYLAVATDALGHEARLRGHVQFLDPSAPSATLVLDGARGDAGWFVGPVTATLRTDTPGAATFFRVGEAGAPVANFTPGDSFVMDESGDVSVEWYASITRGGTLVESLAQTQVVRIDRDDPTGAIVAPTAGVPEGQRVRVRATTHDATSGVGAAALEVLVGSRTSNVTLNRVADGWEADVGPFRSTEAPTLRLFVTDQAGRRALADERTLGVKDQTPPLVSLRLPEGPLRQTADVRADASDDSGISNVTFTLDGKALATIESPPYEATFDTTAWANGPHALNATARDNAGNAATDPATIQVSNPPTICCLQVAPGSAGDPVTLQVEAQAEGGRVASVTLYHRIAGKATFENLTMTPQPCSAPGCSQRTYVATLPGHPTAGTTLEAFALAQDGDAHATAPSKGVLQVPIKVAPNATLAEWRDEASARFAENETQYTPDGAADIVNASILAMPSEVLFGVEVREPFRGDETRTYRVELAPGGGQAPVFAYEMTYDGAWHLAVRDLTTNLTRDPKPGELSLEPRVRELTLRAQTSDVRALMGDGVSGMHARFHTFGSEDFTTSRFIDVEPPLVQHVPPSHVPRGATLHLDITLTDNAPGTLRATVIPLLGGVSLDPLPVVDGHADIPTSGGLVQYVIAGSDAAGNLAIAGPYTVTLDDVTPPKAVAGVVGATDVPEDAVVQFTADGSTDDVGIASYEWDFAPGPAFHADAVGRVAEHAFPAAGEHKVVLRVRDAAGNEAIANVTVRVLDVTGTAPAFVAPVPGAFVRSGLVVARLQAHDESGISSVWVRVDDGSWQAASLDGAEWTYAWAAPEGDHALYARARDGAGNLADAGAPLLLHVDGTPPLVRFASAVGPLATGQVGLFTVTLDDAYGVRDLAWDFGDGETQACDAPACLGAGGVPVLAQHAFASPGERSVRVSATDLAGNVGTAALLVSVHAPPPPPYVPPAGQTIPTPPVIVPRVSDASFALPTAIAGTAARFEAATNDSSDQYRWDFGDGTTATGRVVEHAYAHAGQYAVRLTVETPDHSRATVQRTIDVQVAPQAPPAENPPPPSTPPSPPTPLSHEVRVAGIVGGVIQDALHISAAGLVSVEYAIGDQAALPAVDGTIPLTVLPNGTSTLHLTYHWADGAVTTSALSVTRPEPVPVELEHTSGPTPATETQAPSTGTAPGGWAQARPLLLLTAIVFGVSIIIAVRRSRGR